MNKPKERQTGDAGKRIGTNLRQFRARKGLSIDALSSIIGVSRLTLLKIENGEGNPTLSVIWKIANGLNIPITDLLSIEGEVAVSRKTESLKLSSSDEVFTAEPLFPSYGRTELYRGYLQARGKYEAEAHQTGVTEFVTVMAGGLSIKVDGETYRLEAYDSIRFKGDRLHTYVNTTDQVTILHFMIAYPTL
ncbi:helix-turn-helix domain-containing protein [Sediminibacillus dalangtanensis]|uniref:Helix-turn-helix domain-containing protein n=1 Tax=Sediminibacillus dalangtanensis TaxID=2729421 RepID=A0ABX7VXQ5_9BACI|nr:XRE family transcriptional regulator [Sediminibacillus dalangtanensis]QTM99102.1 helix-turn-helix domain-containing protein [Sediminibacillus dalangtanensis]